MNIDRNSVVVVTGGTAGVGRAVAREFARAGASVAVLAREPGRLQETHDELSALGVKCLALEADVANASRLDDAAAQIERELGPIDIWVNNAMVTVVAPVADMQAGDYQRVTEVTYLGTVWGTMAALKRMRPRNRGTILQVGSALAYRSIPLQSAYCGAKHAIRGFTESLRTELLHDGSEVEVTLVELPAVNTPQFDWCRTTMDHSPQPVGKVYQPEVIGRAIVWAARAGRREVYPTLSSAVAIWGDKWAPGLLDRYLAHAAYEGQESPRPVRADRPDNLYTAAPGQVAAHGRFDAKARSRSLSLWANMNRTPLLLGALAVLAAATGGVVRRR